MSDKECRKDCEVYADWLKAGGTITELEEIETDLNNTIGFLENGIKDNVARIADLQGQLAVSKRELMQHAEALDVFQQLRLLYNYSPNMNEPQTRSAATFLLKQCEEGLRFAENRRKDEYIHKLHGDISDIVENNEKLQGEIAKLEEIETDLNSTISYLERGVDSWKTRAEGLEAELAKHEWIDIKDRLPEKEGFYQCFRKVNQLPTTRHYDILGGWESRDTVTHWKPISLPAQPSESEVE